jgi:hypothetical protein
MTINGAELVNQRKRYVITCAYCGARTTKRDPRATFCSDACRQKAGRQRRVSVRPPSP